MAKAKGPMSDLKGSISDIDKGLKGLISELERERKITEKYFQKRGSRNMEEEAYKTGYSDGVITALDALYALFPEYEKKKSI